MLQNYSVPYTPLLGEKHRLELKEGLAEGGEYRKRGWGVKGGGKLKVEYGLSLAD